MEVGERRAATREVGLVQATDRRERVEQEVWLDLRLQHLEFRRDSLPVELEARHLGLVQPRRRLAGSMTDENDRTRHEADRQPPQRPHQHDLVGNDGPGTPLAPQHQPLADERADQDRHREQRRSQWNAARRHPADQRQRCDHDGTDDGEVAEANEPCAGDVRSRPVSIQRALEQDLRRLREADERGDRRASARQAPGTLAHGPEDTRRRNARDHPRGYWLRDRGRAFRIRGHLEPVRARQRHFVANHPRTTGLPLP